MSSKRPHSPREAPEVGDDDPTVPGTYIGGRPRRPVARSASATEIAAIPAELGGSPAISQVFRASFPEAETTGFRTAAWKNGTTRHPGDLKPLVPTMLHALAMAAKMEKRVGITLVPERAEQPEEPLPYAALFAAASRVAWSLSQRGLKKGDPVLMVMPTCLEFVTCFFGISLAGGIPVPTYPPAQLRAEGALDRLVQIADHAQVRLCITTQRIKPVLGALHLQVKSLEEVLLAEELDAPTAESVKARVHPADPAFIQYTSGSTGRPKGVLLSHANLVANIHAIGQALQIRRTDRVASWLPLYHDMGLIGTLLFSIYWRVPLALMSPTTFLARPRRWLETITRHKCTLSPAPNFAYGLCVKRIPPKDREGLDLSSWRLAMNGAEPVNLRTVIDFQEAFLPHGFKAQAFLPVYGLAESALAVTFPKPGSAVQHETVDRQALANGYAVPMDGRGSVALVSTGWAMPGHQVALVDEKGNAVPDRVVGHVIARGPSVMAGYYRDPEATKAVLRDGWLWTGDLGYVADGQLYVSGRAKDLIILRGKNYYPEDIERVAERVDGVRAGASVAFGVVQEGKEGELAILVVETKLEEQKAKAQLAEAVSTRVAEFAELRLDEVVVVAPGTLPKTSSGKKQRGLTRQLYLEGKLEGRKKSGMNTAMVFARSGAGFLLAKAKRLFSRREPD